MKKDILQILANKFKVPGIISNPEDCSDNKLYAVRSSDSGEDTEQKSNAGKFDSFLFVEKQDLQEKVDKVLEKADNFFIQEMLCQPQFSAVVFKNKNSITINLNNGLCAAITAGQVTGKVYLIKDKSVVRHYGSQVKSLIYENGLMVLKNDYEPNYSYSHVERIIELAEEIEEFMKMETLDLELSYQNGILYVLQCRPWNSKS